MLCFKITIRSRFDNLIVFSNLPLLCVSFRFVLIIFSYHMFVLSVRIRIPSDSTQQVNGHWTRSEVFKYTKWLYYKTSTILRDLPPFPSSIVQVCSLIILYTTIANGNAGAYPGVPEPLLGYDNGYNFQRKK